MSTENATARNSSTSDGWPKMTPGFVSLTACLTGVLIIIIGGLVSDALLHGVVVSVGTAFFSGGMLNILIERLWSKRRVDLEQLEMEPIKEKVHGSIRDLGDSVDKLSKRLSHIEGRFEAFRQLGLNRCHDSRNAARGQFLEYATEFLESLPAKVSRPVEADHSQIPDTEDKDDRVIQVVSSSARGLIGYLDRDLEGGSNSVSKQWRMLIDNNPDRFRFLMTHPAYAHLRQPAEERSSGDIEMEILKTGIYLHCKSGMTSKSLRLYRGSPTLFMLRIGNHILLNPYPYGRMAMDTLCLEFDIEHPEKKGDFREKGTLLDAFAAMHFNHTWSFGNQVEKRVDAKALVVGINSFQDILDSFGECVLSSKPSQLRLTKQQVQGLDNFVDHLRGTNHSLKNNPPPANPFQSFVEQKGLDYYPSEESLAEAPTPDIASTSQP